MRPASRRLLAGRALLIPLLALGAPACGLLLGIDDVPPVEGRPDAHADDVFVAHDTATDHAVDRAIPKDAGVDRHDAGIDTGPPVGQLPARTGPQTASTAEVNFAMREVWIGDTDQTSAFKEDPKAWETFGYNIDGKVTTQFSTDVCTLYSSAPITVQIDGNEGSDDSFGENIVGLLQGLFMGLSETLSDRIQTGAFTVLLDTTGLTQSPTQTNIGLSAKVYGGDEFDGAPTFTTADNWPVNPDTLANGVNLAGGPKIAFSDSYIVGGTWVSGSPGTFAFEATLGGVALALVLHQAVLTFDDTIDDAGAHHAVHGMAAGLLDPNEFFTAVSTAAATANHGQYCSFLGFARQQIFVAQDILGDGTNSEGTACSAISVAIGFTADQIKPPSVVGTSKTIDASASCDAVAPDVHAGD